MKSGSSSLTASQNLVEPPGLVNKRLPETRDGIGFPVFLLCTKAACDCARIRAWPSLLKHQKTERSFGIWYATESLAA
jgi:hypothetical protein